MATEKRLDLIDRKSALEKVCEYCNCGDYEDCEDRCADYMYIKELPTVDAVEVVHGRWIEKPYLLGTTRYCSICGQNYGMPHGVFNYCPNCGAKMDGDWNG